MLALPNEGVSRSVHAHRSQLDVICDWVEASVLFLDDELSRMDVFDFLKDQAIYDDQELAFEQINSIWLQLRRRLSWIGIGSPIKFNGDRMIRSRDWQDVPAHSFLITISLAPYYSSWIKKFGSDYTEQGELFELLTLEAMQVVFNGWRFKATGWSKKTAGKLLKLVPELAKEFCEDHGNIEKWASGKAHDLGLDLAWHMRFPDNRGGFPVYLVQCASGKDWTHKLHTPEIALWEKIIEFKSKPSKAFALPFALLDNDFTHRSPSVNGLILDRYRLLLPEGEQRSWLSPQLKLRLIRWLKPRIKWLLALD